MGNVKTIRDLSNAAPLSDGDFLPVSQPDVYNTFTQQNGDTRRVTVRKLADYVEEGANEYANEKVNEEAQARAQGDAKTYADDKLALKAPIASPTFTGTPQVPSKTAAATNNGTLIATEAQVKAVADSNALKAPIASPTFTGTPTAPTATAKTNNTQIATTAYADRAAHPVGSYYTQYPVTGQSTLANMFPSSESPATLFGGTWTEMYASEDVFFRTGALGSKRGQQWNATTKTFETGTTGIEPDASREFSGYFCFQIGRNVKMALQNDNQFLYTIDDGGDYITISPAGVEIDTYNTYKAWALRYALSRVGPTDTTNHNKNRLIKVWKKTA
jgi:hypothetical protein